jgi:hypothetical protein
LQGRGWVPQGTVVPPSSMGAGQRMSASLRAPVLGRSPAKMNPKAKEFVIGDAPDAATAAVISAAAGVPYPTAASIQPRGLMPPVLPPSSLPPPSSARFNPHDSPIPSHRGGGAAAGYVYSPSPNDVRYARASSYDDAAAHMQPPPPQPSYSSSNYGTYEEEPNDWGHQHAAPQGWDPQAAAAAWAADEYATQQAIAGAPDDAYGNYYAAAGVAAARATVNPYAAANNGVWANASSLAPPGSAGMDYRLAMAQQQYNGPPGAAAVPVPKRYYRHASIPLPISSSPA